MLDDAPVDLSILKEYTEGDPEAMQELIDAFFETAEEGVKVLENNIVDGESDAWSKAGHKLKGAVGYVGAEKLRTLCAQAQNMKTASEEERNALFLQIQNQYNAVCQFLKEQ